MGINQFDSKNPRLEPYPGTSSRHPESNYPLSSPSHGSINVRLVFIFLFMSLLLVSTRLPQVSCLKINPKPCSNAMGEEGTCMFVWECIKTEGKHLGTCVDGFLFGSCCGHNETSNDIDEAINSITADKPVPASSPDINSQSSPSSGSWFNPSSSSPSFPSSSPSPSSSFQTNPWQSYLPAQVSSSSHYPSSSWPTQRPTSSPIGHPSTSSYPNKFTTPATSSPSYHPQHQQPSTSRPTNPSNVPTTSTPPTTPYPSTSPPPSQHPPPPTPAHQEPSPPKPWSPVSSLIQGPSQVNVQQQQQQQQRPPPGHSPAVTQPSIQTTMHTFRPPIFSIFGTHRPPPGTIFFKPQRPTRPTFRPPIQVPVRPTTSIFQPFNPRPSPVPFPQFPSTHATPPAALTSTAMSTTIPSTTTMPSTTTSTTTEATTTPAPFSRPTPLRPNYPQITNNPQTTSQIASGSNSVVTRRPLPPPHHSGKYECGTPPLLPQSKVVGGKNSAFGSWPWQVSVRRTSFFGFSSTHRCGGAIINSQWIATAGHCVDDLLLSQIRIRVGEYDFASAMEPYPFAERGAKRKVVHPNYNFFTYENDLALVQLDEPLDFQPHISPICLPPENIELVGRNATVTGWGRLSEGGVLPSVLQEVKVPIVSNDKCKGMFLSAGRHEYIPEIFMCAGYPEGGRDSCQGDSGGPLQVQGDDGKWFLAGIISWGIGCAEPNLPGVCTRISKFKNWIVSTVNS